MSDHRDDDHPEPLAPFPAQTGESPFPPLYESLDPPSDWMQGADAHDLPTRDRAEGRLARLGRFAFPPEPALDDEAVAARDRRWTSRTIVTTVVFLMIFNAVSPLNWSREQPPSWTQQTVQRLSQVWVEQLAPTGADLPRAGLRDLWKRAEASRFIGQPPATPGDP